MPSPLTQNRGQLLARQALINESATPSVQTRQIKQAEASTRLLTNDQQAEARQQDRLVLQNQQATAVQFRLSTVTRTASNEAQADKVATNRQDMLSYLQTQTRHKILSTPTNLGYA